jgi:hypothetical protein
MPVFFATNLSNSIFIGNGGASSDTSTIKIGTQGTQTSTFIAGIARANVGAGTSVFINANGQLGTVLSSRRYKEDIPSMGAMSDMLAKLRPVSFRCKKPFADGSRPTEYGLIAEEVAEEFPYLAVFNEHGQPETVKYHLLPTFLLEAFQEQQRTIAAQQEELRQQRAINDAQAERMAALEARLLSIEAMLQQPTITAASAGR